MRHHKFITSLLTGITFIITFTSTYAQQKLPNKQPNGLWASANKTDIDGKADEWHNSFQAYNTATNLFYTMANNAEFVYFIAHVKDPAVINRITNYGFTFEIYKNDNPQNRDFISITLPYSLNKYFSLNFNKPTGADSLLEKGIVKNNNALLHKFHKFTVVKGVQGLDSVSIYNDEAGIRFAEGFDSNEDYTIELQLPVKFIKKLPGDNFKFLYRMIINGRPDSGPIGGLTMISSDGSRTSTSAKDFTPEQQAAVDEVTARLNKKYAPTDFKAEYTLVKE